MYWIRSGDPTNILLIVAFILVIWFGGWMFARHSFDLKARERLMIGLALGVGVYLALVNILGRFLPPEIAFWLAGTLVLLLGFFASIGSDVSLLDFRDLKVGRQLGLFLLLVILITLIGRGLGIFDDRKNLSLISTMAAGDIPPHFYMNSTFQFSYHYGFQLFAASLMRVGSLFPWSAFDIAKAIMAALALHLAFLWGWRKSMLARGGFVLAVWVALASGSRWLMLLLPSSWIQRMSAGLELWGTGSESAVNLLTGLSAPWIIDGGPPVPIPFAFVNGIMQPFVLNSQAGPKSLALVMFLLVLLLLRHRKRFTSGFVIVLVLATWALAAEAEFVLFVLGTLIAGLLLRFWQGHERWRIELRMVLLLVSIAGIVSVFQGGTITQFARGIFVNAQPAGVSGGFSLRLPPAIVSSHLGEMHLHDPGEMIIAFFELGPLIILIPLLVWIVFRSIRRGHYLQCALGLSAGLGFLIPILVTYSVDRDITRLTNYSLYVLLFMGSDILIRLWRSSASARVKSLTIAIMASSSFAGIVVLGSLLTAMPRAVFADEITPLDATMARDFWDALPKGVEILDSSSWRAVAVTGRLTRSASNSTSFLTSWEQLKSSPIASDVAASGFDYVYIDRVWWNSMPQAARDSYSSPCTRLIGERFDNDSNGARWLYDVSGCSP